MEGIGTTYIRVSDQPAVAGAAIPPTAQRPAPAQVRTANLAPAAVDSVQQASDVLSLQDDIESAEHKFEADKLALYKEYLVQTRQPLTMDRIQEIRVDLEAAEWRLVARYNHNTARVYRVQKTTLNQLIQRCNGGDNTAAITLQALQARFEARDLSTSSYNLQKSRVHLYAAVLHKRLAWIERRGELRATIKAASQFDPRRISLTRQLSQIDASLTGRRGRVLRDRTELAAVIQKRAVRGSSQKDLRPLKGRVLELNTRDRLRELDTQLGAAPTVQGYLDELPDEIQTGLMGPNEVLPYEQANQLGKHYAAQLAWGKEYLGNALASPANWTVTRRIALLRSRSGNYYAFATEIEPLSQVPSLLRKDAEHRTHPANFQKTTFYQIGSGVKHVSYRGGQFSTLEAAQEAIGAMTRNGATDIHINSLLTPTALPGNPDRGLLKTHYENIQAASTSAEPIMFSNFGVNEGAQGQLVPHLLEKWGIQGPRVDAVLGGKLAFGWHHATRTYNNQAMADLNNRLYKRLSTLATNIDTPSAQEQRLINYYPAIIETAQEIQRVWDTNAFASSADDNDPFKMPALLKVMDLMLGTISYVNCMSGKDRTGELEAAAHLRLAEIDMNLHESTPSKLTADDIQNDLNKLGFDSDSRWLEAKTITPIPFLPGTVGIASRERQGATFEENPYIAANRRQMMAGSGAAAITLQNTNYPGSKVGGGTPILMYSAGFDAERVLSLARDDSNTLDRGALATAAGLSRLPKKTEAKLSQRLAELPDESSDKQIRRWLREVAHEFRKPFQPVVKVKH